MRIGIFGVGVVGTGVLQLIERNHPKLQIVKAYVRDKDKKRDNIPPGVTFVSNYEEILSDPQIDCIVEVMGGTTLAWEIVRAAIMRNKHVVTANKALISKYMKDIKIQLDNHPKVQFEFDAAVCGGIPIIPVVKRLASTDIIKGITGILNGTCNYVLSNMSLKNQDYSEALREAQTAGFAESDPSADVLGYDTRSKLCILAKVAFNVFLDEDQIITCGISSINQVDFMYGKMLNRTIKLLGIAELVEHPQTKAKQLAASVWPTMVLMSSPLAHVNGEINAISLRTENLGETSLFLGPGAGRYPTANSVVADLCQVDANRASLASNECALGPTRLGNIGLATDFSGTFFLRFVVRDRVGIIQAISTILAEHEIMINSILQIPIVDTQYVPFALITETCTFLSVKSVCEEFDSKRSTELDFLLEPVVWLRCFDNL